MGAGDLGRLDHLGGLNVAERAMFSAIVPVKEFDFLRQIADVGAEFLGDPMTEFGAVEPDGAGRGLPHADESARQRRLARSGRADDGHDLARTDIEAHALEGRDLRARRCGDQPLDADVALGGRKEMWSAMTGTLVRSCLVRA